MNASKFILACDVDQVVADLNTPWLARYNALYDDDLTCDRITSWSIDKFTKPECGTKIFELLNDRTLYDEVEPIKGALESIQLLRELGLRVVFTTSTPPDSAGRKLHWLADHGFLQLVHNRSWDYVELGDKSLIRADAMLDDYWGNLERFTGHRILMNEFHNQSMLLRDGFYRAYGWADAAGHIASLYKGYASALL